MLVTFQLRLSHDHSPGRRYDKKNSFGVSPDISRIACCDLGYDRPSGRPRVSDPATYCSSTPRIQPPVVAL
jgi:hypothetical protein